MEVKGTNILITGGCGFIGGHLVKNLVTQGANITVLDILLNSNSIFARKKLKEKTNLQFIDITNRQKVLNIFKKCKPSYIIHLAAQSTVEEAYQNPYHTFETNIMGTVNILDAARLANVKGIIVASSDKAYGKTSKTYRESAPLRGDQPYDVSKSCEDLIAQTYYKTYGLPIVITRSGNVYGEGDFHFGRIIPDICKAVIQKHKLLIRSDGTYVRDYIYVNDVVSGYIFLLGKINQIKGEAFNFSSKDTLFVTEVIKASEKILKIDIPYKILNTAKNEIPYQHLSDKKIRKLGWKHQYSINTTLQGILAWYKDILLDKKIKNE